MQNKALISLGCCSPVTLKTPKWKASTSKVTNNLENEKLKITAVLDRLSKAIDEFCDYDIMHCNPSRSFNS